MRRIPSMFSLVTLACLAISSAHSEAQTIPFFIAGSGDVVSGTLPLAPGVAADHDIQSGWGTKLGPHTGLGAIQLIAPPDLANLTAEFASARPFKFTSAWNSNDVLACNYGVTTGPLPAKKPGLATFYSIDAGADPASPFDNTFIMVFLAEFRPALAECSGKFDSSRLKNGSFQMLAVSGPVNIDPVNGVVVNASGGPIPYSWLGVGTLKFKWPFGWF